MIKFDKTKDKIAIIAPASSVFGLSEEENLKIIDNAISLFKDLGIDCIFYEGIFQENSLPFFVAPQEARLKQLIRALEDPEVKNNMGLRGGYGSTEIVFDERLYKLKPNGEKILIGFSDITALHALFNQFYQMPSIHGPVIASLLDESKKPMLSEVLELLDGKESKIALSRIENSASSKKIIQGELIGGNLNIFCNLLGTKLQPRGAGKIIILEDVNERGYQVHRQLVHLKNAGVLADAAAVILADFTKTDQNLAAAISDFCQRHIPLTACFRLSGIGHGEINHPVILGVAAQIVDSEWLVTL